MNSDDWSVIGTVHSSKIKKRVLELLSSNPKTPIMLKSLTKYHISHISRALFELKELGLILCKNPNSRKGKFYDITEKGILILNKINDLNSIEK